MKLSTVLSTLNNKADVLVYLNSTYELEGGYTLHDCEGNYHAENWVDALNECNDFDVERIEPQIQEGLYDSRLQYVVYLKADKNEETEKLGDLANRYALMRVFNGQV